MKKTWVISLGGSTIIPEEINFNFLDKFKKTLKKHSGKNRFVIVCGGGSIARKYIKALKEQGKNEKEQSLAGIRATRMNALFMMQLFGKEANDYLPKDMKDVKDLLKKNNFVFCGALRYAPDETSDGTAAKLAKILYSDFINITNIKGLFSDNPLKNKKARFIPKISWKEFEKMALKIPYKPGQHFVLDQNASTIIRENKIRTYIIGNEVKNLDCLLRGKRFTGTTIEG